MSARGIRLNNPGNIRLGLAWQGQADIQNDPDFITFISPEYGIRAMAKVLMTYRNKYDVQTVTALIKKWAPPNENDTDSYINAVADDSGFSPDDEIDLTDASTLAKIIPAIITHENGSQPYTAGQIALGISKAILSK